jgi:hypothetical protein
VPSFQSLTSQERGQPECHTENRQNIHDVLKSEFFQYLVYFALGQAGAGR